jgi:hypothetical protein
MPDRAERVASQIGLGADREGVGTPFYHAQQLGSTAMGERLIEQSLTLKPF